jgi:hypothetical protein
MLTATALSQRPTAVDLCHAMSFRLRLSVAQALLSSALLKGAAMSGSGMAGDAEIFVHNMLSLMQLAQLC